MPSVCTYCIRFAVNLGDGTPSPTQFNNSEKIYASDSATNIDVMSSAATTNRASEMWNNVEVNNLNAAKNYGYKQYPSMNGYYNYHNSSYSQNSDYMVSSAGYQAKMYGQHPNEAFVKTEPVNWQGYPNHMNAEMINKWREINYYSQQSYGDYSCDQTIHPLTQQYSDDARSINSPGQCSIPDTSYGSPQSTSSNVKSRTPEVDDSPNLRALLTKPETKKPSSYFVKTHKTYSQDMLQQMMNSREISEWEKSDKTTAKKECNLTQFHGRFDSEGQTSVKEVAVGGAPVQSEVAPSSREPPERCQDVTRVETGGDAVDYAENKMAAATEAQGYYPWMKSTNGKLRFRFLSNLQVLDY